MTNSSVDCISYKQYIASPAWRTKRAARLELDGHRCRLCDHDGSKWHLEVHHRPSSYKRIPNESVERDLITLCKRCHDLVTSAIRGDRYGGRKHEVVFVDEVQAKEIVRDDVESKKVQIEFADPIIDAQRPISSAPEQVVAYAEGDFWEEKQDRRGLRRDVEN